MRNACFPPSFSGGRPKLLWPQSDLLPEAAWCGAEWSDPNSRTAWGRGILGLFEGRVDPG